VDSSKIAVQPGTEGEKDFSFLEENRTSDKTVQAKLSENCKYTEMI
jgi:hypothetical protein